MKSLLEESGCITLDQIIPCSVDEVVHLEKKLKITLPSAYKEFLLWMGHSGAEFLRGSDCFYKNLLQLKNWAVELLEENNFPETLPSEAFVFFMHQGYQFGFFKLTEGDDPPIYYYNEVDHKKTFELSYINFSEFLSTEIEARINFCQTSKK